MTSNFGNDNFVRGTQAWPPRPTQPLSLPPLDSGWEKIVEGAKKLQETVETVRERFELIYRSAHTAGVLDRSFEYLDLKYEVPPHQKWMLDELTRTLRAPIPLRRDILVALNRFQSALYLLEEIEEAQAYPNDPPREGLFEETRLHAYHLSTVSEIFRENSMLANLFPTARATAPSLTGRLSTTGEIEFQKKNLEQLSEQAHALMSRTIFWPPLFKPLLDIRTPQGLPATKLVTIRQAPARILGLRLLREPKVLDMLQNVINLRERLQHVLAGLQNVDPETAIKRLRNLHRELSEYVRLCKLHPLLKDMLVSSGQAAAPA